MNIHKVVQNLYLKDVEGQVDAQDREGVLIKRNGASSILTTNPFIFLKG